MMVIGLNKAQLLRIRLRELRTIWSNLRSFRLNYIQEAESRIGPVSTTDLIQVQNLYIMLAYIKVII